MRGGHCVRTSDQEIARWNKEADAAAAEKKAYEKELATAEVRCVQGCLCFCVGGQCACGNYTHTHSHTNTHTHFHEFMALRLRVCLHVCVCLSARGFTFLLVCKSDGASRVARIFRG